MFTFSEDVREIPTKNFLFFPPFSPPFFLNERTPRLGTPRNGSPPALSSSSVGSEKIYFDEENAVSSV